VRTAADIIAGHAQNGEAVLARHREALWLLGIRAAILRAEAARLCRRSRWQARRARYLLQRHARRGVATIASPRCRKSGRRRSRAHLVVV
jgi:hypothetical protein